MRTKQAKRPRPKMPRISEETKQVSAMLGGELSTWSKVKTRPMFGLRGFYRGRKIFAALPVTRAINNPNSLIFRIKPMPPALLERANKEPRIHTAKRATGAKRSVFELNSNADHPDTSVR